MTSRRQKKQKPQQRNQQQEDAPSQLSPPPELSAFSLAAAIQEARTSSPTPVATEDSARSRLPIFSKIISSSPLKKKNPSQVSLATNTSFATANDNTTPNQNITPAVSYFVDSSDEETQESLTFGNDPLSVLSRNQDVKPTEITFENHLNPEETMPTMPKKLTSKIAPMMTATAVPAAAAVPVTTTKVVVKAKKTDNEPHFDVAQNVYGCTKDIWAWGKTVPVLSNVLGLTEGVTAKVLDITIHMDLPAIDQDVVVPNVKKLDDQVLTPAISAIWGIISGTVKKGDDMIVKPVMTEVVPRILGPLGLMEKKEEKKDPVDKGINPEVVPVLN